MSGNTVPYHLRPNKFVDRQLFISLIKSLHHYITPESSLYITFGGPYLSDLRLMHSLLGIDNMLSIDMDQWVVDRQGVNNFKTTISLKKMKSSELIRNWAVHTSLIQIKNVIAWLDYSAPDYQDQLTEIKSLCDKLKHGDILRVTLNAQWPPYLKSPKHRISNPSNLWQDRDKFVNNKIIGTWKIPMHNDCIKNEDFGLVNQLLASVKYVILDSSAAKTDSEFIPLLNTTYADGQRMLTITILKATKGFNTTGLDDIKWLTRSWTDVKRINLPFLSNAERIFLDRLMSTGKNTAKQLAKELPLAKTESESIELLEQYIEYYRKYPNFQHVMF